jgi:hypothetical protein
VRTICHAKYCFGGCGQLTPEINKYLKGYGLLRIGFFTGHAWERAPESPFGACPDRDSQLLQGPPNRRAAKAATARGWANGEDDDEGLSRES